MKKLFKSAVLVVFILMVVGCKKTDITLIDNLKLEIGSEIKIFSLVKEIKNGTIITEDEVINTSALGEVQVHFKYANEKDEEKVYIFKVEIVDTQKPIIEYNKEIKAVINIEPDLLNGVKVTDNSKEEIKPLIEGQYDYKTAGKYILKYVAVDSSGNKAAAEFTLVIEADKNQKYLGKYVGQSNSGTFNAKETYVELKTNGKFSASVNMCEGWYKDSGTYTISGSILTLNKTSYMPKTTFKINGNKLTYRSGGMVDKAYDCSFVTSLKKN